MAEHLVFCRSLGATHAAEVHAACGHCIAQHAEVERPRLEIRLDYDGRARRGGTSGKAVWECTACRCRIEAATRLAAIAELCGEPIRSATHSSPFGGSDSSTSVEVAKEEPEEIPF